MTKKVAEIKEGFRSMFPQVWEIMEGVVARVNDDNTIDVMLDEGGEEFDIKLRAVADGNNTGFYCVPSVGSQVVYGKIRGESDFVLLKTSDIDKVIIDAAVRVEVNGGGNKGVPLSDKVTERLNKIESDLNAIKQAFTSWVPAPNDGGAALKAAAGTWLGQLLQQTLYTDIQNEKFIQ